MVNNSVEELVDEAHLPMPKLYLINDPSMNAFATGRNPQHAVVAITRGLLEKLTLKEVKLPLGPLKRENSKKIF